MKLWSQPEDVNLWCSSSGLADGKSIRHVWGILPNFLGRWEMKYSEINALHGIAKSNVQGIVTQDFSRCEKNVDMQNFTWKQIARGKKKIRKKLYITPQSQMKWKSLTASTTTVMCESWHITSQSYVTRVALNTFSIPWLHTNWALERQLRYSPRTMAPNSVFNTMTSEHAIYSFAALQNTTGLQSNSGFKGLDWTKSLNGIDIAIE